MKEMTKADSPLFFLLLFTGLFLVPSIQSIPTENEKTVETGTKVILNLTNAVIVNQVDRKFLSVALDTDQLAIKWSRVNLTSKKIRDLTRRLLPANLRLGGTDADKIEFCPDENKCDKDRVLVSGKDILVLTDFVKDTGVDFIYGLNVLQRTVNTSTSETFWNSTNTKSLLEFLSKNQVKVLGFELGNEPDSFLNKHNVSVEAPKLAKDFSSLKQVLKNFDMYKNSLIIGPDVTIVPSPKSRQLRYLNDFLANVDSLDAVTIHQYYFDGRLATPEDFMNVTIMDMLKAEINLAKSSVQKYQKDKLLWIGETASGWGGGSPNISDRFASSFLWLDKLGQSARYGVNTVFRQALKAGSYGLLNFKEEPTPDYFTSVLHKRLVGQGTFGFYDLTLASSSGQKSNLESGSAPPGLRLYVHCTKTSDKNNGSLTVFGINVENEGFDILINEIPSKSQNLIEEYILTAPNVTSKYSYLNGRILKMEKDDIFPSLDPNVVLRNQNSFYLPKTSFGFWVFPWAQHPLCL